jgi:FixJ family two-component response regulator
MNRAGEAATIIYVVDDDVYVRQGLENLLQSVGLQVETFVSVDEFLKGVRPESLGCLVLDVRLPGLNGLDFQVELKKSNINMPVVFITGHGDIPMTVRAMKAGAVEFLTKPIREQDFLDAVRVALDRDRTQRNTARIAAELRARFESLTAREREVVALVTSGKLNKQVAADIGVSEVTVKVNRRNAMKKLGARSLADLVRIVDSVSARTQGKGHESRIKDEHNLMYIARDFSFVTKP